MKESPPEDPAATNTSGPQDPAAADANQAKAKQALEDAIRNMEKGGDMPKVPLGNGRGMSMMVMNGRARMTSPNQTMAQFAEWLVRQLDRPVVDQTGLTKKYDLALEYAPESTGGRGPMGMALPPPPLSGDGGRMPPEVDSQGAAPTLFAALQEQLGLKLEQKKGPVELLVVDRLEKAPTEN
jgi:uncharacterized protein (TIGR03435 family)